MSESHVDLDKMRKLLLKHRQEILELEAVHDESNQVVELDQSKMGRLSRMDALQGQAMAKETKRRDELELKRIASALQRIDAGDYGCCQQCEEPISQERLLIEPTATLCIGCANQAEH